MPPPSMRSALVTRSLFVLAAVSIAPGITSCAGQERRPAVPAQTWTATSELRIGSINESDYSLTTISDLVVGSNGAIYVAQPLEKQVRIYDHRGRFVKTFGRGGAGPGEFQDVRTIGWARDTLWVRDRALGRISLFTPEGEFVETVDFHHRVDSSAWTWGGPWALLADGSVMACFGMVLIDDRFAILPVLRFSRTGEIIDTIFNESRERGILHISNSVFEGSGPQPFSDAQLHAWSPDGQAVAVVDRRVDAESDDPHYTVTKIDFLGDTIFHRDYRYTPVPLDPATVDEWIDGYLGMLRPRIRLPRSTVTEALYVPSHLPPVKALVLGSDSTVWLQEPGTEPGVAKWRVLGPDGSVLAFAALPAALTLFQANGERLWGVEHDEFDVPYVVRYRLQRASRTE
jgi:hypothetical protein